ncbi:hypothetical protein [Streptomyces sp. OE57]|uniref:hypothetical protein n=1 Tax=Streptomyces lacaronensis TaxID=3379885 RepID=UPI0039B7211A
MVYGPRTEAELDVARTVIQASYRYATGRDEATVGDTGGDKPVRDRHHRQAQCNVLRRPLASKAG